MDVTAVGCTGLLLPALLFERMNTKAEHSKTNVLLYYLVFIDNSVAPFNGRRNYTLGGGD
jgi:hypothetical protein